MSKTEDQPLLGSTLALHTGVPAVNAVLREGDAHMAAATQQYRIALAEIEAEKSGTQALLRTIIEQNAALQCQQTAVATILLLLVSYIEAADEETQEAPPPTGTEGPLS